MSLTPESHRLLYRVAQAYYLEGQTQQQIAERFGVSRPKVSRLLQRARDARIVNITLVPPPGGHANLEQALEYRYSLDEAVVVQTSDPAAPGMVAHELGPAAADCLLRLLEPDCILGLAWGRSLLAMVEALPAHPVTGVTVVQLNGGLGPVGMLEHSAELARAAAQKLSARLRLVPAPGIVSTAEAARVLRADAQIADALATGASADIAVVGMGVPTPESVLLSSGSIVTTEDLVALAQAGAVGDIVLRYLDAAGSPIDLPLNDRIVGVTLDQLKAIPRVIGVAGGTGKLGIVRSALLAGLIDILVTDQMTAEMLLLDEMVKNETAGERGARGG